MTQESTPVSLDAVVGVPAAGVLAAAAVARVAPGSAGTKLPVAEVRTSVRIPMEFGDGYRTHAQVFTFRGLLDRQEHVALGLGDFAGARVPLVRLHSECLTGDVFGSARCDCGPQLRDAAQKISATGGYLVYLRQEGRGIGLYNKLDAYALQDGGLNTYEANEALGLPSDGRDYAAAAQILTTLGAREIQLLSNNPDKAAQLSRHGIAVLDKVPTGVFVTSSNLRYLQAKVSVTGHRIALEPATAASTAASAARPVQTSASATTSTTASASAA